MNDEIIIEEEIEEEKKDEIEMEGDDVVYKLEKDYNKLDNKPSINNVPLEGNKTLDEFGIQPKGNYVEQEEGKGLISDTEKAQIETNKTDIATIKTEQITQNNNITNLQNNKANVDDVYNKTTIDDMLDTKANKSETYTKTETDALLQDKADTEDIPDVSGFIDRNVNNLINYTLKTNTGSLIDLEINSTTYVVTLRLKDIDGNVISTDTIDLPLESVVVSGRFDNTTKKVILTLENGSEVDFSVADLVAGLQTEITSENKLNADYVDDSNSGNKFTNTTEKQTWNNKYEKPSGGIPKTDLASAVQNSLNKADSALQEHQDVSGKEDKSNKVTEIDENSTDTQYPSAKAVQNSQAEQDENIEANTEEIQNILNMLPKGPATGEEITINDSANYKFKKFGIKGNTEQDSYTGKNKFNINWFQPRTTNGITATIENDHLLLNGTATERAYINFAIPSNTFEDNNNYWYLKSDVELSNFHINETGSTGTGSINMTPTTNWAREVLNSYVSTGGFLAISPGTVLNNCKVYIYVNDENVAVSNFVYEPYVRTEFQAHLQNIHKK